MRVRPISQVSAASEGQAIGPEWRYGQVNDHHHGQVNDHHRAHLADALVRSGDEDRVVFRENYIPTSAKLCGICLTIYGNMRAAEDVLQSIYLTIWRRAGSWEPGRGSAIAWLAAIARNESIDWRRSQTLQRAGSLEDASDIPDASPCAETRLLRGEMSELRAKCLSSLEPRAREVISAAFLHGLTYAELAARDGEPLGTINSVICRGLARLKDQFAATELLPVERRGL